MIYVQYYENKGYNPRLNLDMWEQACGDRGVLILDGRNSIATMHHDAQTNNGEHNMIVNLYIKGRLVTTNKRTITWFDNCIPNTLKELGLDKEQARALFYSLRKRITENDTGIFIDNPKTKSRIEFIGE